MLLLPLAAATPDLAQSIADPAQRRVAEACEAGLSRKAGGEISTLDVTRFRRAGRETILAGTIRVFHKPPTRPGEMTATHVVVLRYSYQCRLRGKQAPRIKVNRLDD
jgi:hypothetical protein